MDSQKATRKLRELLLNYSSMCDIIEVDVLEKTKNMKIRTLLQLHPYKITPPTEKNNRWQTYVLTKNGTVKKKLRAKTEIELYEKLIDFYSEEDNTGITLEEYYETWLKKKTLSTVSMETIRRHTQHWKKYYVGSEVIKIPLCKLTKSQIEDFLHKTIRKYDLSKTELNNMKIILKGALELALDEGIITTNPFLRVKLNYKLCRYVPKKSNTTQIYREEEKERFFRALEADYNDNPDITDDLAIKFLFQTGLRVGELVALKWSDITDGHIHIQRMERREGEMLDDLSFTSQKVKVVNHVKTKNEDGDRFLYLTNKAMDILQKVKEVNKRMHYSDHNYIFVDEKGRTTARAIAYRIEKICNHAGLSVKSSHDIRRTVASELNASGMPLDEIRRMLGHSNEQTTLGYIFNPYTDEKTNAIIEKALG